MTASTENRDTNDLSKIHLEPARIELLSTKTQMVFAAIVSTFLLFALYWPTLKTGFLHDDFLHVDYVARAVLKGDFHDLVANFYANWGGSNIMLCYRPCITASYFTDFLLFRENAVGSHITNVLWTAACCIYLGLIATELSGAFGNRMRASTAIWAALIFAAYPLHVESVSWVIGRVDLLCSAFYLASLYYFLRYRLVEENLYLWLSCICLVLSLASKEMAVTLPAVATVFAIFIPPRSDNAVSGGGILSKIFHKPAPHELRALGFLWLTLIVFAIARTLMLGHAIGGYGQSNVLAMFANFANKASLMKIILPVNEEVMTPSKTLSQIAWIPYICALVFAAIRCLVTPALTRYFLVFILWAVIAVLPTFQVWQIAPNLVGSRLFFLSSAALSLFFAFAFVPGDDWIDKKASKVLSIAGSLILAFTMVFFCVISRSNMTPYIEVAPLMTALQTQLDEKYTAQPGKFLLLNLPYDHKGAAMVTRPHYFEIMMRPPLARLPLSENIVTAEPEMPGDQRLYWREMLMDGIAKNPAARVIVWSNADSKVLDWKQPGGADNFIARFDNAAMLMFKPKKIRQENGLNWHVFNSRYKQIERVHDGVNLYPGLDNPALDAETPIADANPLSIPLIKIKMTVNTEQPVERLLHLIRFSWKQDQSILTKDKMANLLQTGKDEFECPVLNNKEWLLGGDVKAVGLSLLPCPYFVKLHSIEGVAENKCTPKLTLEKGADGKNVLKLDSSEISGATSTLILVSRPDTNFDNTIDVNVLRNYRNIKVKPGTETPESPDTSITSKVLSSIVVKSTAGPVSLPSDIEKDVYNGGKTHQIIALALDKNGAVIGLPSRILKVK